MSETENIFSFQKSAGGGYEARALGHCIFAQADTRDELRGNVKDAVPCHFGGRKTFPSIRLVASQGEFPRLGKGGIHRARRFERSVAEGDRGTLLVVKKLSSEAKATIPSI